MNGLRPLATLLLLALSVPAASQAGDKRTRFVLEGGAAIEGYVVAADREVLTIESGGLGRVRIPRDSVQRIVEPGSVPPRHHSAHERRAPTASGANENIDLWALEPTGDDPESLRERARSLRLVDPLPAKIAD